MLYLLHKMFFICMKSFFKLSFCDIDLEIIINYNINEKDMIYNITQIIHDIGIDGYSPRGKEYVFLKLLDESIGVHMGKCNAKNNMEKAFLEERIMI